MVKTCASGPVIVADGASTSRRVLRRRRRVELREGSIMLDYEILRLIWWAAARRAADRLRRHGRLRPRRRRCCCRSSARRDAERRVVDQHHRPGLGRQPGVAHPRRRRDLRRLAAALRRRLLRLLPRDVSGAGRADPAPGRLRVPLTRSTDPAWRAFWDWALFVGGLVPALVFGVAFGNVLQGVPFRFDDDDAHDLRGHACSVCSILRAALRPR